MKTYTLLLCCLLSFATAHAQLVDLGIHAGISGYFGDLNPTVKASSFSQPRPAFGAFGRIGIVEGVAGRFSITHLSISADDSKSEDFARQQRNLSFRSRMTEAALVLEIYPFSSLETGAFNHFQPYFFGGGSLFYHNPQAELNGVWYDLQPLSTEGQETSANPDQDRYARLDLSIPFGAGVVFFLSNDFNLGIEVGMRKTFTDYLDDVSTVYVDPNILKAEIGDIAAQLADRTGELGVNAMIENTPGKIRGQSDNQDWYFFGGLTLSYTIMDGGKKGRWWGSARKGDSF
jgi:hypothetical protein